MTMASPSRGSQSSAGVSGLVRPRKRPHHQPPVFNGVSNSYEDKNNDFLCPICFDVISAAYMTKCGHSFCHGCIERSLEQNSRCPKCLFAIDTKEDIFPNSLLNELILKHKQKMEIKRVRMEKLNGHSTSELQEFLAQESETLDLSDVNYMLDILAQKKKELESDCKAAQLELLKEFLCQVRSRKQEQLDHLTKELKIIDGDAQRVREQLQKELNKPSTEPIATTSDTTGFGESAPSTSSSREAFNASKNGGRQQFYQSSLANRRKRMTIHFDDLEHCYFNMRCKGFEQGDGSGDNLEKFEESLSKFTRYSGMRPLATLSYANDIFNGSSIVSSIEFDKDNEFFAIAGVTKKIKVFEYGSIVRDTVDMHYPVHEMICNSKISCVSWSSYHKGMMASSDYEGTVTIWDAFTGQKSRVFQEHEKRCWSVDFNHVDVQLVASGSDDAKVKLWSTSMEHSVASIEAKANVCCVKFNPQSRYHLAFGSADHCVHYYDLRQQKQPLAVFKGHRKAVSYAKFLNPEEIVSASTDSQLKLWNVNKSHCLKSFKGHTNEKNFVGLATDGDYIACGSENNSLFIYYKGLSQQLLSFKFDTVRNVLEKDKKEDEANEFVSAVCWRQGSNIVVAANSQGTIKILELV